MLLARDVPRGVVIRRGPSKVTATYAWDLETDEITLGQWVRARVYEYRSDLSPDGRYLAYFAYDGRPHRAGKAWLAISRAPFLKAVEVFAQCDTWHRGALWVAPDRIWIDGENELSVPGLSVEAGEAIQTGGVSVSRLLRDGWQLEGDEPPSSAGWRWDPTSAGPLARPGPFDWVLVSYPRTGWAESGRSILWNEYALASADRARTIPLDQVEWADIRESWLLFARRGSIFRAEIRPEGLGPELLVRDFSRERFARVVAPY